MRLLFVIDSLNSGGAQRQLVSLASELAHRKHQVTVFVYHASRFFEQVLESAGVTIDRISKRHRFSISPIQRLNRRFRNQQDDVVVAFLRSPGTYALLAKFISRSPTPVVVSDRSCHNPGVYGRLQPWTERLFTRATHVVVNSHHLREHYQNHFPRAAQRISTIWNGIDLSDHTPSPPPDPVDYLRILCVGNIAAYKNWQVVVDAVHLLKSEYHINAKVTHAGRIEGLARKNQGCLDMLKAQLEKHHLNDHWSWLGRVQDTQSLYATHDIVVHPSLVEGLPNVVCEALACGRPVAASEALDHPRLIQHQVSGFLFDPNSPSQLAGDLAEFYSLDLPKRKVMSDQASRFAAEELNLTNMVDQFEALLSSLAHR